jgi:hypothetical protein
MFVSPAGRRWDYLHDRRITCPDGHHIPDTLSVDESGYVRCSKVLGDSRDRNSGNRPQCLKWIFLLWIRGGGNIVVEVTEQERDRMRAMASATERIDYLGIFRRSAA